MSFDWSYVCSFQQDLLTVQMVSQRDAMLSQSALTAFVFRCWVFYGICVAFAIYVKWTSFIQGIKFSISSSKLWFERQWFSFASPNYPVNFGFLSFFWEHWGLCLRPSILMANGYGKQQGLFQWLLIWYWKLSLKAFWRILGQTNYCFRSGI